MMNADVLIQAGHEGRTSGATGGESLWGKEIEWTPIVADEATSILRNAGIKVLRKNAFLSPDKYKVKLAIFIHFDAPDKPYSTGVFMGYNDLSDKPASDSWKSLYSKHWPFTWMDDNYTKNLKGYYGFRYTNTSDAELVFELGELTCEEQAFWLKPRLKIIGALIAHFVSIRLNQGNIPEPSFDIF